MVFGLDSAKVEVRAELAEAGRRGARGYRLCLLADVVAIVLITLFTLARNAGVVGVGFANVCIAVCGVLTVASLIPSLMYDRRSGRARDALDACDRWDALVADARSWYREFSRDDAAVRSGRLYRVMIDFDRRSAPFCLNQSTQLGLFVSPYRGEQRLAEVNDVFDQEAFELRQMWLDLFELSARSRLSAG